MIGEATSFKRVLVIKPPFNSRISGTNYDLKFNLLWECDVGDGIPLFQ